MIETARIGEWKVNLMLVSRTVEKADDQELLHSAWVSDSPIICISVLFHGHTKMFRLGCLNKPEGSTNSARELKWQYSSCAWVCMAFPVQSNFFFTKLDVGIPPPPLRKALRHVTSFKAHSCLITMALDHFRTFCCPIEPSAGPTLSHAHSSSILLLLLSNHWLPLQQRSHTEWMEPPEECGHKRRNVILLSVTPSTRPLRHTHAHTHRLTQKHPYKSRHV